MVCGQLLVHWIEAALDRGVERDLWNLGFRNTITQLQAQAKDKQQVPVWCQYFRVKVSVSHKKSFQTFEFFVIIIFFGLQGGSSEARDLLGWFLNSASGFYLQLFNQICSEYGLDLPFRRLVYGFVGL